MTGVIEFRAVIRHQPPHPVYNPFAPRLALGNGSAWNDEGVRAIVRFTQGNHGSIIDPSTAVGATAEIQGQMIGFLQSEGMELEVIYHPVVK